RADRVRIELGSVQPDLRAVADYLETEPVRLTRRGGRRRELAAVPPVLRRQVRDRREILSEVDVLVDVVRDEAGEHRRRQRYGIPTRCGVADARDRRAGIGQPCRRPERPTLRQRGRARQARAGRRLGSCGCAFRVPDDDERKEQRADEKEPPGGESAAGDSRSWHRSLPLVPLSLGTLTRPGYEPNTPVLNLATR